VKSFSLPVKNIAYRCFRFLLPRHWVTWFVGVGLLLVLVIVLVPGETTTASESHLGFHEDPLEEDVRKLLSETKARWQAQLPRPELGLSAYFSARAYEHGWPWPYLLRTDGVGPFIPPKRSAINSPPSSAIPDWISWCRRDNWPLSSGYSIFYPTMLVVDVLVAASILFGACGLLEWRFRVHDGKWKFTTFDLFALMTLTIVAVGFFANHYRIRRIESNVYDLGIDRVQRRSFETLGTYEWESRPSRKHFATSEYRGPVWLRKLTGNANLCTFMWHLTSLNVSLEHDWRQRCQLISQLPYLTHLQISSEMPIGAIEALRKNCPRITHLQIRDFPRRGRPVDDDDSPDRPLRADELVKLRPLELRSIAIYSREIEIENFDQLLEDSDMKFVALDRDALDYAARQELEAKYPDIEFFYTANY